MSIKEKLCHYRIDPKSVRFVDGDTFEADVDLGDNTIRTKRKIKISLVDAPAVRGAPKLEKQAAAAVMSFMYQMFDWCVSEVVIELHSIDSLGYWNSTVTVINPAGKEVVLGTKLISMGLCRVYYGRGGKKKKVWTEKALKSIIKKVDFSSYASDKVAAWKALRDEFWK